MNWAILFACIVIVESNGNPNLIGDLNLPNHAYGVAQIRQPYLDDVNRVYRAEVIKTYGRLLTTQDVIDPQTAEWVVIRYLQYWGKKYTKKTGKEPTYEVYARMHNGGPSGWNKESTEGYWKKVERQLRAKGWEE